jgi:hypothetical protein
MDRLVVAHLEVFRSDDIGGLLLAEVGRSITRSECKNSITVLSAVFSAMRDLHALGIIHGDARLANIVVCGRSDDSAAVQARHSTFKWIDLRWSIGSAKTDWLCLLHSVLAIDPKKFPAALTAVMSAYLDDSTDANFTAFREAVTELLKST